MFGAACTIHAAAPPPTPNLPEANRAPVSARIVAVEAPNDDVCSDHAGLKDFCVKGFYTAFSHGLNDALSRFFHAPAAGSGDYLVSFRMIEFNHSPTSGNSKDGRPSVQVAMRWQFTVRGRDGRPVLDLTETTVGPQQLINVGAADTVVAALNNAVLERIARALFEARVRFDPNASVPPPPPPPASPARAGCVPGATQECVGPGGCRGGQFCEKDGSAFSPCDCGAPAGPRAN
jgi:hypothetical protein